MTLFQHLATPASETKGGELLENSLLGLAFAAALGGFKSNTLSHLMMNLGLKSGVPGAAAAAPGQTSAVNPADRGTMGIEDDHRYLRGLALSAARQRARGGDTFTALQRNQALATLLKELPSGAAKRLKEILGFETETRSEKQRRKVLNRDGGEAEVQEFVSVTNNYAGDEIFMFLTDLILQSDGDLTTVRTILETSGALRNAEDTAKVAGAKTKEEMVELMTFITEATALFNRLQGPYAFRFQRTLQIMRAEPIAPLLKAYRDSANDPQKKAAFVAAMREIAPADNVVIQRATAERAATRRRHSIIAWVIAASGLALLIGAIIAVASRLN